MTVTTVLLALLAGLAAGMLAGLFGVGGGILFVPVLVALGLGQLEAGATSLLAVVPTAAVAAQRQRGKGTIDQRAAVAVGIASIAGVLLGARIATRLDEGVLRRLFAVLVLAVAAQLAWRALRTPSRVP